MKPHYKLTESGPVPAGMLVPAAARKAVAEAFTAASRSHPDMRRWTPLPGSADSDLLTEQGTIVSRSRDLARNHGVADGARQVYQDNIVGCGLRLSAKPRWKMLGRTSEWAEEWGNQIEDLWATWFSTKACDVTGQLTGDGLTAQVQNSAFLNGEALALPLWLPNRGNRFATCMQVIEPDRLSNPNYRPDTDTLRGGVEIDRYGRPLAYHIRKTHPGDAWLGLGSGLGMGEWERIPAMTPHGRLRVIHANASREERANYSRGKPSLTAVMRQFKVLGDLTNAELKAAVVNAMVAIVTESAIGQEGLVELLSNNPDALANYQQSLASRGGSVDFAGGRIIPLQLGEKISSFSSNRPNTSFDSFVTMLFRHIATGIHIPYELLMKDFSKTNYSSARAALLEAWRFFRGRRKWIATYWLTPVYRLFLEELVNAGLVDVEPNDFYANADAYCGCRWIGDGRGWVDPLKEAQAAELRMELNISTLEDECAEQGGDWQEKLDQRARELAYIKALEEKHEIKFPSASDRPRPPIDNTPEEPIPGAPAPSNTREPAAVEH